MVIPDPDVFSRQWLTGHGSYLRGTGEPAQRQLTTRMQYEPPPPPPSDDKDWTWVLHERCTECGFDPATVEASDIAASVQAYIPRWIDVLDRPAVATRPTPQTWSPLEYSCHVRDVFTRFAGRVQQMLDTLDPLFENWDQDRTAIDDRYWEQAPAAVARQLEAAGNAVADMFDSVDADEWQRRGRRSNGSRFTVETLGRYFLHDVVHHLHDVNA